MRLATAASMKNADYTAIHNRHIPSLELMETASGFLAEEARPLLASGGSLFVFAGTGNNGGDGIGAAWLLGREWFPVTLCLVGSPEKLTPDAKAMLRRFEEVPAECRRFLPFCPENLDAITEGVQKASVIIDALFGIGLSRPLSGDFRTAAELMNNASACILSADIPSGISADTGEVLGYAVNAHKTLTFSMAKPGHLLCPGKVHTGTLKICDIGIPQDITDAIRDPITAVTKEDVRLPRRKLDAHKGDFGRCLILGGCTGFSGAPVFAANAAVRAGAGLVFLGVPESIYLPTATRCYEAMPSPLPCSREGTLTQEALPWIRKKLASCDVCLIGPGLSRSEDLSTLVFTVLKEAVCPVILDADGINAVSGNIDILQSTKFPPILTPHEGEFLRLGGDLSRGRLQAAKEFSKTHNVILVLKGNDTITAFPDGEVFLNTSGNPGMAKGGSGDVLAGILTALVGQKFPLKQAIPWGVFLHGLAGDLAANALTPYAMTPQDMIAMLPEAFLQVL